MQQTTITAYAPASIGNVSLGFDLLGAALAPLDGSRLGDNVSVTPADQFSLSLKGGFAHKLPGEAKDNIVTRCYDYFHQRAKQQVASAGGPLDPAALTLEKNLPIGSGLGSSASSIVAAFVALNEFYGQLFDQDTLLRMMGELEGQISGSIHYDNVAPSYLGGMTLMVETPQVLTSQLPVFDDWHWVVCYSGRSVSTAAARDILPTAFALKDTLTFGRQLAVFVDALHRGDKTLAAAMVQDVIAEPHRKTLLPGFDAAKQFSQQQGALAFGISGSGPTVFALCDSLSVAESIDAWLGRHYIENKDGFSHICALDTQGARCL